MKRKPVGKPKAGFFELTELFLRNLVLIRSFYCSGSTETTFSTRFLITKNIQPWQPLMCDEIMALRIHVLGRTSWFEVFFYGLRNQVLNIRGA